MKNTHKDYQNVKKMKTNSKTGFIESIDKSRKTTSVGTCLGNCVKCGSSCCLDAGHPGPHFCYLCK